MLNTASWNTSKHCYKSRQNILLTVLFPSLWSRWYLMADITANRLPSSGRKFCPMGQISTKYDCNKNVYSVVLHHRSTPTSFIYIQFYDMIKHNARHQCAVQNGLKSYSICESYILFGMFVYRLPWQHPDMTAFKWSITSFRFCFAFSPLRSSRRKVSSKKQSKITSITSLTTNEFGWFLIFVWISYTIEWHTHSQATDKHLSCEHYICITHQYYGFCENIYDLKLDVISNVMSQTDELYANDILCWKQHWSPVNSTEMSKWHISHIYM